jgi:type II restriction enzyme
MFTDLLQQIFSLSELGFLEATDGITKAVNSVSNFTDVLEQIGTIPEDIVHDSTEEKLFAKASDAVLSRAFRELGLKSTVIRERADAADVIAESPLYGYTMVADAKAFRMSRTAKNQKDFKVTALSGWRKDSDYALLCAPYFQYPRVQSQIYAQSTENNVCLFSWEHLIFLIRNGVRETLDVNLSPLWNFGSEYAETVVVAKKKNCFITEYNTRTLNLLGFAYDDFTVALKAQADVIKKRGDIERHYWSEQITLIKEYSREQAIEELIRAKKIDKKIRQIAQYIRGIHCD